MADEYGVIKEISCKLFHMAKAWIDLLAQLLVDMAKYIPSKLLHMAEGFVSLSSQKLFAMAKHIPSVLFHKVNDCVSLLSQELLHMADYILRELVRMGKGCASFLAAKLSLMTGYVSSKLSDMSTGFLSLLVDTAMFIPCKLFDMSKGFASLLVNTAMYIPCRLFDTARGGVSLLLQVPRQFYGTGIGKASALILAIFLLRKVYRTKKGKAVAKFLVLHFIQLFDSGKGPKGTKPPPHPAGFSPLTEIHIGTRTNKPTEPKNYPKLSPKKIIVAPEIKKTTEPKYEQTSSSSGTNAAQKNLLPVYAVPDDLKDLMKKDKVPQVLRNPLTASTYSAYFAALLHAEDYYIEKWNGFLMSNVTLQLHEEPSHARKNKNSFSKKNKDGTKIGSGDKKVYLVFEIDSVPENRPFLLSRDFVFIKPTGMVVDPFKGYLSRVVKNTWVWTEFGDDFYSQYSSQCKYDVSFSFNRVPIKRTHEAVATASDPSFRVFLFPGPSSRISFPIPFSVIPFSRFLDRDQISAITQILSLKSPPPYLVEGPLSVTYDNQISRAGEVLIEAILRLYRASPDHRILLVAPKNHTCDLLMIRLQEEIPVSELFRANAAFRDLGDVHEEILPLCLYEGECFTCPSLSELRKYRVMTSTYISSFRLRSSGINAGYFSHIFLVDASSATEPETMVALTNLASEKTAVVVTGSLKDRPVWVRSDIARKNGLTISYFQRLLNNKPYSDRNPQFVEHLRPE